MSKFYPWIDTANDKVMSATDFENDSQRKSGFQSGQAASSIRVNSALRQANLFVAALAEVVLTNNTTLNLTSSLVEVKTALAASHPFNIPVYYKLRNNVSVGSEANVFATTINSSVALGMSNNIGRSKCYVIGVSNITANTDTSTSAFPVLVMGIGLTLGLQYPQANGKFVTGRYNVDCGKAMRETGAGSGDNVRKTVEKLDEDGNLYVKSVVLSDNITDTDDEDDVKLNKDDLAKMIRFANPLKIQAIDGTKTLTNEEISRLKEGSVQVFGIDGSVAYFTEKNVDDSKRAYITFDGGLSNTTITHQIFEVDFNAKTIVRKS